MIVALTGTPGSGKTTVAKELEARGSKVIHLHSLLEEEGLLSEYDEEHDSYNVDLEEASEAILPLFESEMTVILESHLSHLLPCDMIIVLRCSPSTIKERLTSRGYDDAKIFENMEAEALDVILVESVETGRRCHELDCSNLSPNEVAAVVLGLIEGTVEGYFPGRVDWSEELIQWC